MVLIKKSNVHLRDLREKSLAIYGEEHLRKSARSAGNKIRTKGNLRENFRIVMSEM